VLNRPSTAAGMACDWISCKREMRVDWAPCIILLQCIRSMYCSIFPIFAPPVVVIKIFMPRAHAQCRDGHIHSSAPADFQLNSLAGDLRPMAISEAGRPMLLPRTPWRTADFLREQLRHAGPCILYHILGQYSRSARV
jgi:hypothetical protein